MHSSIHFLPCYSIWKGKILGGDQLTIVAIFAISYWSKVQWKHHFNHSPSTLMMIKCGIICKIIFVLGNNRQIIDTSAWLLCYSDSVTNKLKYLIMYKQPFLKCNALTNVFKSLRWADSSSNKNFKTLLFSSKESSDPWFAT